jgi:hypothetical protein
MSIDRGVPTTGVVGGRLRGHDHANSNASRGKKTVAPVPENFHKFARF